MLLLCVDLTPVNPSSAAMGVTEFRQKVTTPEKKTVKQRQRWCTINQYQNSLFWFDKTKNKHCNRPLGKEIHPTVPLRVEKCIDMRRIVQNITFAHTSCLCFLEADDVSSQPIQESSEVLIAAPQGGSQSIHIPGHHLHFFVQSSTTKKQPQKIIISLVSAHAQ